MADRYFVETPIEESDAAQGAVVGRRAELGGSEAHHLIHVMRAQPGGRVVLFDGSGAEFPATIERVGRSKVELTVTGREPIDRELPRDLVLGVALPKGDRQRWLVQKAVELGVRRLVPLRTERSVAQPAAGAMKRLRRAVIEASKQCGRNRLMEIAEPQTWRDYLTGRASPSYRLLAHPQRRDQTGGIRLPAITGDDPAYLSVGPEGGFTDEEVSAALAAGWQAVDLGPRILRIETAAVLLVALAVAAS